MPFNLLTARQTGVHCPGRLRRTAFLLSLLALPGHAQDPVRLQGSELQWGGCGPTYRTIHSVIATPFEQRTGIRLRHLGGGADFGLRGPVDGDIDIGGSCRINRPVDQGNRSEYFSRLVPFAWDGLAVVVHPMNPVHALSSHQVRAIYRGRITHWSELGGSDQTIRLLFPESPYSPLSVLVRQHVLKDLGQDPAALVADLVTVANGAEMVEQVLAGENTIAILPLSLVRHQRARIVRVDGTIPGAGSISDGAYPFYMPLFLVTGPEVSRAAQTLLDFVRSDEAKLLFRAADILPYTDAPWLHDSHIFPE